MEHNKNHQWITGDNGEVYGCSCQAKPVIDNGYCSKCYGLDDDMSDCDNCLGTGKELDEAI